MQPRSFFWTTEAAISADLDLTAEVTPAVPVAPVARMIDDTVLVAPMEGAT